MKKIITLLSALIMIFALSLFFNASAKEMTEDQFKVVIDNVVYALDREREYIEFKEGAGYYVDTNVGYSYHVENFFYDDKVSETVTELNIASEVNGLPVTSIKIDYTNPEINDTCKKFRKNINKITLPDTIVTIYSYSFIKFTNLKEINIPEKVTTIGHKAFNRCESLTEIRLPETVTHISDYAFAHCKNLETINFPSSLKKIGDYAFVNTNLKEITIPENCIIRHRAFKDCKKLVKVTIDFVGKYAEYYTIPKKVFLNCKNLKSVYFTGIQTKINTGEDAFKGCKKLKTIYFFGSEQLWENTCMTGRRAKYYDKFSVYYFVHDHNFKKAKNTDTFSCDCGIKYTFRSTKTNKHNYTKWVTSKNLHCKEGTSHVLACRCGKKADFILKSTNAHRFGKWKTTKKATLEAKGSKERICQLCNKKETLVLPKLKDLSTIGCYVGYPYVTYKPGEEAKARVYAVDGNTRLTDGVHYKVSYENNKAVTNKAVAIFKGIEKNGYTGTVKIYFNVIPRNPENQKAKKLDATTYKLTWDKIDEATGYIIADNTNYDFQEIATTKKTSYTLKNLEPGREYEIRVCSYTLVNGEKILSDHSFCTLYITT